MRVFLSSICFLVFEIIVFHEATLKSWKIVLLQEIWTSVFRLEKK
jgi:hypothetical protein